MLSETPKSQRPRAFLQPKEGFDWRKVQWGKPDEPRTQTCSYCGRPFPEDETANFIPLIIWKQDGHAAEFCEECQREWFGMWTPEGETK